MLRYGFKGFDKKELFAGVVEKMRAEKDICFAAVYGSHMYGIADDMSDLDVIVVLTPTMADIISGKASDEIMRVDGCHVRTATIVDVHDAICKGDVWLLGALSDFRSVYWCDDVL